jgi:hypothetical protein
METHAAARTYARLKYAIYVLAHCMREMYKLLVHAYVSHMMHAVVAVFVCDRAIGSVQVRCISWAIADVVRLMTH